MAYVLFVLLAPVTIAVVAAVAALVYERLRGRLRLALLTLSVAEIGWILTSSGHIVVSSPALTVAIVRAMYVFMVATVMAWTWFALLYAKRWRSRAWRGLLVAFGAASAVFLALTFTNERHGLVWEQVDMATRGPFQVPDFVLGPALIVQAVLTWGVLSVSLVLLLRAASNREQSRRVFSRWVVAAVIVPVLLNAATVLGLWSLEKDFTAIALAFSSAALGIALARSRALDVRPLARTALVECLREGVLVLDAESRIADVNPAARALIGRSGPLLGLHIGEVLDPDQREAAQRLWGKESAQAEIPFLVDGAARYYDLHISPITNPEGERAGRLILIYDITELRAQQDALTDANTRLQSQNADLDDFAHTVAHDLKTSIQHLVGHAELLREDGPRLSREEHRDLADGLVKAGIKLDSIVQELLLFATTRRGAIAPVPLDMDAVFGEAMDRLRPTLHATGATVEVTSDWPDVLGYAAWVETVWYNYVSNAAKYGGPNARITVCADPPDEEGQVRFWVQDYGSGLSAEQQMRLFTPFSRVADTGDGHGLGLSIVQRIMDRLGGACGVESTGVMGEGSRFWFSLPASAAPTDHD